VTASAPPEQERSRWAPLGAAALAAVVTLAAGGTVGDLLVAYWLEGLILVAVVHARIRSSRGVFTEEALLALTQLKENGEPLPCVAQVRPYVGRPLPVDLRRQVARETLRGNLVITGMVGAFAFVFAGKVFGGLSPDPLMWVLLVLSMGAGHAVDLVLWLRSGEPETATPGLGYDAPIMRTVCVFVVIWLTAVLGGGHGPVVGVVLLTLAKGLAEEALVRAQRRGLQRGLQDGLRGG
jgi:hypothetical protein